MSRCRGFLRIATILLAALALPGAASAQLSTVPDDVFDRVWAEVNAEFAQELERTPAAEREPVFVRMLDRMLTHRDIVGRRNSPGYRAALVEMVRELPDSSLAQSTNAPLTNPGSNQILERSGFSELIALAADARKLFSADDSAVSINLNAVALFGGGKGGDRSAQYVYARNERWRRLGGTVTFGSKIPEKEITGLSAVPSADTLFDAMAWDIKVRIVGDRDPRASRWYPLLVGEAGDNVELLTRVNSRADVDPADVGPLLAAANTVSGRQLTAVRREVARSLQVSVKVAGQHLTKVAGKNKFSGVLMLDKGFGSGLDFTANLGFSAADAAAIDATDPFRTKEWQLSAGVTGSVLKDTFAAGRAIELTGAASSKLPVDDDAVPVDRKRVLYANFSLSIPFQAKAKIPFSFTYSNDPNNPVKANIVSGQVGLSYDFGAISGLLK